MTRPTSSIKPANDLTREDVERALHLASHKTAEELRDELGAFPAVKYQICFGSEVYDAKIIIQLAWNVRNPGRELAASDFRGSREHIAEPLRALGFEVLEIATHRRFGSIPGVRIGDTFDDRKALSRSGIHRPLQAGISGSATDGADSIVVSGGYVDDQDFGDRIIYTGHGGNDPKRRQRPQHETADRGSRPHSRKHGISYLMRPWTPRPGDSRQARRIRIRALNRIPIRRPLPGHQLLA